MPTRRTHHEAPTEEALYRPHRRYFEDLSQLMSRAKSSTAALFVRETPDDESEQLLRGRLVTPPVIARTIRAGLIP